MTLTLIAALLALQPQDHAQHHDHAAPQPSLPLPPDDRPPSVARIQCGEVVHSYSSEHRPTPDCAALLALRGVGGVHWIERSATVVNVIDTRRVPK